MSDEYLALVTKVQAFASATTARRAPDMACRAGCDACCRTWLTVSAVEAEQIRQGLAALSAEVRARVAARGRAELERESATDAEPHCAMLEADGTCTVYAHRPLVCRTQGHALRYPPDFIPVEAVRGTAQNGDVTWCPLNYTSAPPRSEDVLDAERVDRILALVNQRFASAREGEPLRRASLSALAAEADVLGCRGQHDRDARRPPNGDGRAG